MKANIFNKCQSILIATLALSTASNALADKDRGGQNARVCFSDAQVFEQVRRRIAAGDDQIRDEDLPFVTSVESYDLFRMKLKFGEGTSPQLDLPRPGETEAVFIDRIARRMNTLIPYVKYNLDYLSKQFLQANQTYEPFGVFFVDDANPTGPVGYQIPPGARTAANCLLATLANQTLSQAEPGAFGYTPTQVSLRLDGRFFGPDSIGLDVHPMESRILTKFHEMILLNSRIKGYFSSDRTVEIQRLFLTRNLGISMNDAIGILNANGFAPWSAKWDKSGKQFVVTAPLDIGHSYGAQAIEARWKHLISDIEEQVIAIVKRSDEEKALLEKLSQGLIQELKDGRLKAGQDNAALLASYGLKAKDLTFSPEHDQGTLALHELNILQMQSDFSLEEFQSRQYLPKFRWPLTPDIIERPFTASQRQALDRLKDAARSIVRSKRDRLQQYVQSLSINRPWGEIHTQIPGLGPAAADAINDVMLQEWLSEDVRAVRLGPDFGVPPSRRGWEFVWWGRQLLYGYGNDLQPTAGRKMQPKKPEGLDRILSGSLYEYTW